MSDSGSVTGMQGAKTLSGHQIATNALLLTMSKIVSRVSVIGLFILLSYLITKEDYGSFRQVWMVNKSLIEIFALGFPISIYYFLPRLAGGEKKIFVVQSVLLLTALALLLSLILFLFSESIARIFDNPEIAPLLRLFALFPVFYMPALALESVLVALDKAVPFSVFTLIDRILFLAAAAATVHLFRSLNAVFAVLIVFAILELGVTLFMVIHYMKGFEMMSKKLETARQIRFAIPSGISNVVDVFNHEFDKLVIAASFSVSRFAVYANGGFEIPIIGTIASSVTSVLMPEYAKRHEKGDFTGILDLWHGSVCRVAMLIVPLMMFCLVFSGDLITLMFSDKYEDSAIIFRIYLLATIPKVTWYASVLMAMGYSREPLYGSFISLSGNVVLSLLLIRIIGFTGPAIATVTTSYIVAFYFLHRIREAMNIDWGRVFPWRNLGQITLWSAVLCVMFWPLLLLEDWPGVARMAVALPVYGAVVLLVFRKLNLISGEDWAYAVRMFSKLTGKEVKWA